MENIKIYFFALALAISAILTFEMCVDLENKSRSWRTTFEMVSFDGKYQNVKKKTILLIFTLDLLVSKILTFEIFDLEKIGHGHSTTFAMFPFDSK